VLSKSIPNFISTNRIKSAHTWQSFTTSSHYLIILYCLSAALSIFASQVFLGVLVLFWLSLYLKDSLNKNNQSQHVISKDVSAIWLALILWILLSFFSALVGVSTKDAFPESLKIALCMQLPFIICFSIRSTPEISIKKSFTYAFTLLISFGLAAIHTAISTGIGEGILPRTPGPVTESGQLVLIIPIALVVFYFSNSKMKYASAFIGISSFVSFVIFCWPSLISANLTPLKPTLIQIIAVVALAIPLIISIKKKQKDILISILIGIVIGALLVNLKRGPWFGVIAEFIILGILLSRKLLIATISGCSLLVLLEPTRQRIFSLTDHFLIEGGRFDMWTIGAEIAARFPLGLGLDNAEFMRALDPSLPPTHRHMHNNLLNIVVETGWLGLAAYLWWLFLILKLSHKLWITFSTRGEDKLAKLSLCIGTALFGWQLSGLVEYNFGDTEIQIIALFLMGILFALSDMADKKQKNVK